MTDIAQKTSPKPRQSATATGRDPVAGSSSSSSLQSALWLGLTWLTLGLPTLIYPIGRDQGVFSYIGQRLFDGSRLYVDLWDVKSPLIYWMYGLALNFSGSHIIGVRIMDMLFAAVSAYLVYTITMRLRIIHGQRAGVVAGILYLAWYYLPNDYRVLANCESFMTPFLLLGILFIIKASLVRDNSSHATTLTLWFWGGAALGATMLFKTTGAVFLGPAVIAAYLIPANRQTRDRLLSVCAVGFGFALPLLLGWIYLVRTGAMEDWLFLNLTYLPSYTSVSHAHGILTELSKVLYIIRDLALIYPAMVAGVALLGMLAVKRWLSERAGAGQSGRGQYALLYLVLSFGVVYASIIAVQGKYLHYHFLPLLGPFAVVVAVATLRAIEDFRISPWVKTLAFLTLAIGLAHSWKLPQRYLALGKMALDSDYHEQYCEELSTGNFPCGVSHRIGKFLREKSEPGDKLFIWSFEPEIYFLSGLEPASRFLFNTPFLAGEVASTWKVELMIDLMLAPPEFIVLGDKDGLPLITGERYSSKEQLKAVRGLAEFIDSNYTPIETIGNFTILKRNVFGQINRNNTGKRL